jgi:sulfite exporter TauE/SafE
MFGAQASAALSSIVHIIQVALTPVFLLAGIATLLNVFSTRLASVSNQVDALAKTLEDADAETAAMLSMRLTQLYRRSLALDAAVALAAAAGALTCGTVLALFVGEAGSLAIAAMLYVSFGLAIACALAAIGAFTTEMLIASRHIRAEVQAGQRRAEPE